MQQPFEIWQDPQTSVRFYFSHSNAEFTTGVLVIPPRTELPKHNRPLAVENLVQVAGKCVMHVFDEHDNASEHVLDIASTLIMPKGQYHIHANPYDDPSYTLFKGVGDITAVVDAVRQSFTHIEPVPA